MATCHNAAGLRSLVLAGTLALAGSGCVFHHYDLTLQNGTVIRAKTKPKLDHGYYVFKDTAGKEIEINSMRVKEIQPVRPGSPASKPF
jgi:hypothetical protein